MVVRTTNYQAPSTEPCRNYQPPVPYYQPQHDKNAHYIRRFGQHLQPGVPPRVSPYTAAINLQYPRFIIRDPHYGPYAALSAPAYHKHYDCHPSESRMRCGRELRDPEHGELLDDGQRAQGSCVTPVDEEVACQSEEPHTDEAEMQELNSNVKHRCRGDDHDCCNHSSRQDTPNIRNQQTNLHQQQKLYRGEYQHRLPRHIRVHKQPLYTDFQQTYRESIQRGDAYLRQVKRFIHLPPEVKQQLLPHEDDRQPSSRPSRHRLHLNNPNTRHPQQSQRVVAIRSSLNPHSSSDNSFSDQHDRRAPPAAASRNTVHSKPKGRGSSRPNRDELEFLYSRIRFLEAQLRQLHQRIGKTPVDTNDRGDEHQTHLNNQTNISHASASSDVDETFTPTALTTIPEKIIDESSSLLGSKEAFTTNSARIQCPIHGIQTAPENSSVHNDQTYQTEKNLNDNATVPSETTDKVVVILRSRVPASPYQSEPHGKQMLSPAQKPLVCGPEPPPHREQRPEIFNTTYNQFEKMQLSNGAKQHGKKDRPIRAVEGIVEGIERHIVYHYSTPNGTPVKFRYFPKEEKTDSQQNMIDTNENHLIAQRTHNHSSSSSESENTKSSSASSPSHSSSDKSH